jgi:hypothetical protein
MPAVLDLADLVAARAAGDGYTVYRGAVPEKPPGAYAVLYFGAGSSYGTRLAGRPDELRWTFRVVCAGYSERQVLNTVDLVRARLTGFRLLDANGPMLTELEDDPSLLRDDSVASDIRFSFTLTYRLHTTRS